MPSVQDHDMDHPRSPSPPLPPDPSVHTLRKVQNFQEQYTSPTVQQAQGQGPLQQQYPQQQQQPLPFVESKSANTGRSRTTSRARAPPVLHQPQPIKDAVNNAFDNSPVVQNQLDPELVRQVTEQVIKNLQQQTANLATPTASVQPQQTQYAAPPPQPPPPQPSARSPTLSSTDSIPPRYTPPSPEKRGWGEDDGHDSPEREPLHSDTGSTYSRGSVTSKTSDRNHETPRPLHSDSAARMRRSNTTGRRRGDVGSDDERPRRESGSRATVRDHSRPIRKDSVDSEGSYYQTASQSRSGRPRLPSDTADPNESTTLEKIWRPLFDNGNPTERLGQLLRGLAVHLVEHYEPMGSLVVTPPKMMRFFNETKVPSEHYPWETIFGGKMGPASVSTMYRKLLCQHHLVQSQNHELPSVPGLTPKGFAWFMTCLIQAHPDTEFDRLALAVMNMPISNADDSKERFPKELSRRLLPSQPNLQAEQRLIASLNHEPHLIQLRGALNMPPPPPASATPQPFSSFPERERKPYSQTPASNVIDDDDLIPPSMPIERERKPYSGKEGMGKTYGENDAQREREPTRPPTSQYRPEMPIPHRRNSRSNSGLPPPSFQSNGTVDPVNIQPPPSRHRGSIPIGPPPAMTNNGTPKSGRRATPPPRNPFARSEPTEVGSIPSSQYASNLHPAGPRDHYAGDPDDDTLRRYHDRRPADRSNANGNSGEESSGGRGYPIPPRQPPSQQQGYDAGYNSAGGPPVGSYPRGGLSADARRSTWYGSVNAGPGAGGVGGSDGYGSFAGNGGGGYNTQQYGSSGQH